MAMDEMIREMKGLKDGKAPGGDGIPAEKGNTCPKLRDRSAQNDIYIYKAH